MFNRKRKLKRLFDNNLRTLLYETKIEWSQAKEAESALSEYNEEVIVHRKIAECKHFFLYKEAKARKLGME